MHSGITILTITHRDATRYGRRGALATVSTCFGMPTIERDGEFLRISWSEDSPRASSPGASMLMIRAEDLIGISVVPRLESDDA